MKLKGFFDVQLWKGHKLETYDRVPNDVVNQGYNRLLDVMFHGTTQIATWYIGLIDNSGFSAIALTDTHETHAGWTENTDYSESTRPAWPEDAASSQAITNTTLVDFTFTDTQAIKGLFIASLSTKGSTSSSGVLWSAASFDVVKNVSNGDVLKVAYSVSKP